MSIQVIPTPAPSVLRPPDPVPVTPSQVTFILGENAQTEAQQDAQIAALLARVAALEVSVPAVGMVWSQVTPGATWTVPHGLGRIPAVQVLVAGEVVYSDVYPTATEVVIVFPSPTAGVAVLT